MSRILPTDACQVYIKRNHTIAGACLNPQHVLELLTTPLKISSRSVHIDDLDFLFNLKSSSPKCDMVHYLATTNLARILHISRVINADLGAFDPSTQHRSSRHGSQQLIGGTVSRIQASSSNWACLFQTKHCARVRLQTDSTACRIRFGANRATQAVSEGRFVAKKPE